MFWQFTVLLFCLWFRFVCCWGNLFGWKIWNVVVLQCFHFHKCVSFEDINCISLPGLPIFRGEHLSLHPRSHLVPFGASRVWRWSTGLHCCLGAVKLAECWGITVHSKACSLCSKPCLMHQLCSVLYFHVQEWAFTFLVHAFAFFCMLLSLVLNSSPYPHLAQKRSSKLLHLQAEGKAL